ncbi:C6 transcription factor, putative [Trichophyton verrucosum HKI 0517]|uniref:C6 transcription factor, putative n=1 Tax=Trichophyton verrucosum (strain HKI 0517) TaxID=663202 RepID=D4D109_TRIVH|nr:C6 transcription factor, putative [Trichophyton verrucosum HKI 0517]EFE44486.1 C6 transcription factor, putative [Trichophyton verrucosum HKI 0517]
MLSLTNPDANFIALNPVVADRLEEVIQAQARLIETHIIQAQQRPGNEVQSNQCPPTTTLYSSPSDRSAAPEPSPKDILYPHSTASNFPTAHRRISAVATYNQEQTTSTPSDRSFNTTSPIQLQNGLSPQKVPPPPGETVSLADHNADLPPYDLLYSLVDLFFEHINGWLPILHRRTTLDTLFGPSPLSEEDRMLLYAIVATTLRFSKDTRLNEENKKRYHDALVILTLDVVGTSNGPPGWKLLAVIARSVVQLGLAVEATSSLVATMFPSIYTLRANILPDSRNWVEDEGRRRLFWAAYLLDRYSTIATAFDFALDIKEVDRKLPCKDEYFVKNQPVETRFLDTHEQLECVSRSQYMGSFGFYMEVLGILSKIHLFLKQPVDISAIADVNQWQSTYRKLDNELTAWEYQLPKEYSFAMSTRYLAPSKSRSVHCGWIMLHAAYQTTIIRLHSSAAYPTTRSPIFTPSYGAIQRCLAAVERIRTIAGFVVDNNVLDKFGPPFAFTLWVSARLLLVNGSTVAHTLDPAITFFVDSLRRMGQYWKVAKRYSEILQRVLDEYNEFEQSGSADANRTAPSSVKILADMRRCAFDLDFLISHQPPRAGSSSHTPVAGGSIASVGGLITPKATNATPIAPQRNLNPHELEYLDVFDFFNVPRIPLPGGGNTAAPPINGLAVMDQAQQVTVPSAQPQANSSAVTATVGGISVTDLANAAAAGAAAAAQATNEFNITNYMVPTPETDWLFRATA